MDDSLLKRFWASTPERRALRSQLPDDVSSGAGLCVLGGWACLKRTSAACSPPPSLSTPPDG